jgi:hypothetical protein
MKTIMAVLFALCAGTAFADCTVSLTQWGVNGEHLSNHYVLSQVNSTFEEKGYNFTEESNARFNLHLHYYGMISESGKSKTVGTVLTFSSLRVGKKETIATARNERFLGSQRRISKATLQKNIVKIKENIPECI